MPETASPAARKRRCTAHEAVTRSLTRHQFIRERNIGPYTSNDRLQAVAEGRKARLLIAVPPRHLKSICPAAALAAWQLGHPPKKKALVAGRGSDLAIGTRSIASAKQLGAQAAPANPPRHPTKRRVR